MREGLSTSDLQNAIVQKLVSSHLLMYMHASLRGSSTY